MKSKRVLYIALAMAVILMAATLFTACDFGNNGANEVTITFADGRNVISSVTMEAGVAIKAEQIPAAPEGHAGQSFLGYFVGKDKVEPGYATDVSVFAYARFEQRLCDLTLNFDASKGSVTATEPISNGKYAVGENVTITVTPFEGYIVKTAKLNGTDVALTAGKYTFSINGDSTFVVEFDAEEITDEVTALLAGIQDSVCFEGTLTNHDFWVGDEVTTEEFCLFDTAAGAVWTYTIADGEYSFYAVYKDVDGIVNIVTHDNKGKLQLIEGKDSLTGAAAPFSDYSNPFADIAADDLQYIGNYKWQISDLALAKVIARNITGYTEDVESFVLTAEGGKFVALDIVIARLTDESRYLDYQYIYHYDISEHGSAAVPAEWLGDYSMSAKQIELKTALEQAAAAGSYTINFHSEEIGEEDLDYHIYVTHDAIYEDNVGWESGYCLRGDGSVWSFDYIDGEVKFSEKQSKTIAQLGAQFVLSDIDYSMLEYVGDGAYRIRDVDVMLLGSYTGATSSVAYAFGVGDRQIYFQAAYDVTIYLKGGKLWKVELSYNLGQIAEDIVMTFEAFGATELPIKIVDNSDYSSWSKYIGSYEGSKDNHEYAIEITEDSVIVVIDGDEKDVKINDYSAIDGFDLTIDGVNYTLMSYDDTPVNQLELVTQDGSVTVFLTRRSAQTECDWTAYIGTFEGTNNDGVPCTVNIDETTVTVTIGEETYTFDAAGSYQQDYMGGYFAIEIDGAMWDISSNEYSTDEFSSIVMFPDDNVRNYFELTRKSGGGQGGDQGGGPSVQGKWSQYIGTYADSDGKYVIEITATEVKVTIDGVAATVEISEYDESEGFTLSVNGEEMYLLAFGYAEPVTSIMYSNEDWSISVSLTRVSDAEDEPPVQSSWEKYKGTYADSDGKYVIEITATEVKVTINGVAATVSIVEYDVSEGFTLLVNGVETYVLDASYNVPVTKIMIMMGDDYANLDRTA